jgi:molybdopterin converting factor small subunit
MLVHVKLFGPLSRAVGQPEVTVTLDRAAPTCAMLRAALAEREPRLAHWLSGCRFAVNREFAAEERPIAAGDEIALIGFVSGG